MWTDLPPDTATVLRNAKKKKLTRSLNIFFREDGVVQVSAQNPTSSTSYHINHNTDAALAIAYVLGPPPGGSWAEWLADDKPAPEEDYGDDLDVV